MRTVMPSRTRVYDPSNWLIICALHAYFKKSMYPYCAAQQQHTGHWFATLSRGWALACQGAYQQEHGAGRPLTHFQ